MKGRVVRLAAGIGLALGMLPATAVHASSTLDVPSNTFPTIQSAINAAQTGDTVVVSPGTYHENLDFLGKAITVESSGGAASTVVDASGSGTVVSFHNAETHSAVLQGFTIQNGNANGQATAPGVYDGGGIYIAGASPTIENDVVTGNSACGDAGGIDVDGGSPLIQADTITGNHAGADGCSGGIMGGGLYILSAGQAQVIGNTITNNTTPFEGGGVGLFGAGSPMLENNKVSGNSAGSAGGGVAAVNQSDAEMIQNLITANSGGGVYWSTPSGTNGPIFTNDTIASNTGTGLYVVGYDGQSRYFNTIVSAPSGYSAVVCDTTYQGQAPVFDHSDAAGGFGAGCQLASGDLTADPALDTTFHLTASSAAIDTGSNSEPLLPSTDLDGKPRIINGTVDMGVYEYGMPAPVASLSPSGVNFGSVPGGSTATATFTLSNTGSAAISVTADSVTGSTYFNKAADGCLDQTVNPGAGCTISVSFYAGAPGAFSGTLSVTDGAGMQTSSLAATGSMGRPSFNPTSLAFGTVKVNHQSGAKTVTVTNVGNATLHLATVSVQGANPADFRITSDSCSGQAIAPGGTCAISVVFKPQAIGTRTANLSFPCDDAVPVHSVPLSGTGSKG